MTALRVAYSLLSALLTGFFLISGTFRRSGAIASPLTRIFLGAGFGLGGLSVAYFLWKLLLFPDGKGVPFLDTLILGASAVYYGVTSRRVSPDRHLPPNRSLQSRMLLPLAFSFAILAACALLLFWFRSLSNPHGNWDAVGIWNLRARFMVRGGDHWTDMFSPSFYYFKPDYPLLLPGAVARSWSYAGEELLLVPALVAMCFTFSIPGMVLAGLRELRGWMHGLLGGIAILGTPLFLLQGPAQYADIPAAFYFLASTMALCMAGRYPGMGKSYLAFAGVAAGFAAWTKNEGVLFIGCLAASLLLVPLSLKRLDGMMRRVGWFGAGLLPLALLVSVFRAGYAPTNQHIALQLKEFHLSMIGDLSRHVTILKAFLQEELVLPFLACTSAILFFGYSKEWAGRVEVTVSATTLLLMVVAHYGVFLTTPYPLEWHLVNALYRLLLQLWPSFVFLVFLLVGSNNDAMRGV